LQQAALQLANSRIIRHPPEFLTTSLPCANIAKTQTTSELLPTLNAEVFKAGARQLGLAKTLIGMPASWPFDAWCLCSLEQRAPRIRQ
jgi:hypothetical protein